MAPALSLRSDTARGALLAVAGLVLVALGALVPVPTGGGVEALVAGVAILLGLAGLLIGLILFLMATRV
ncbi:MAG TPA: hypothetical protein VGR28_07495 [Candidatus Thermoplasmatota archaeon]|jgi:hypothetical protein|nr:hypothetical protein [Candidatus Thermoplasmatota archaeon]